MEKLRDSNWEEVFASWKSREGSDPAWQKVATEVKGWPDWESWRRHSAEMLLADKRQWSIYSFEDPLKDIPEMLVLKNIDHAFVCMNLPYTMSVEQAARAVLALQPKNVYPYHYRTQGVDPNETIATFKALVAADAKINVVMLKWY